MKHLTAISDFVVQERWNILVLLLLGFSAYGITFFNWVIVSDEWERSINPLFQLYDAIAIGRWTIALIWRFWSDNLFAPSCNGIFALCMIVVSALSIVTQFGAKTPMEKVVASSLLFIHPVITAHFAYPSHHVSIGFGFALSALFLRLITGIMGTHHKEEKAGFPFQEVACAAVFLCLVTGIRQSFFLLNAVLTLGMFIRLSLPRNEDPQQKPSLGTPLLTLALGLVLWFVVWRLGQMLFEVTDKTFLPAYQFSSSLVSNLGELQSTFLRVASHFKSYLFESQPLWPTSVKWSFLVLMGLYLYSAIRLIRTPKNNTSSKILIFSILILLLFLAPWGICLIRTPDTSYRYTALLGLIPIYPIIFLGGLSRLGQGRARVFALGIAVFLVLVLVRHQCAGLLAVRLNNERELLTLNRMIGRIENHPDFSKTKGRYNLHLVGFQFSASSDESLFWVPSKKTMAIGRRGMNQFNIRFQWKLNFLMTHRQRPRVFEWKKPQIHQMKKFFPRHTFLKSLKELSESEPWPSAQSIKFVGNDVFVVLSKRDWLKRYIAKHLK